MARPTITVDGNEAVSQVAYHASEIIAIYPITPASPRASSPTSGRRAASATCGASCPR